MAAGDARRPTKSPDTIDSYVRRARYHLTWCAAGLNEHPSPRPALQRWATYILDSGAEPPTARIRQQAVRRLTAWLTDEREIDHNPLLGLEPSKIVERLTDDELRSCAGYTPFAASYCSKHKRRQYMARQTPISIE